jgi:DNA (cytosine-5)-methyltransferase 1
VRAWDAIGGLELDEIPEMRGRFADLLPSIPEGRNYQHFTPEEEGTRSLFGYRTRYWSFLLKLAKDEPAWTLAANPGPSTGPFHWDNRPLAIAEMLRLQTFPADWYVSGDRWRQVRQVGNATPPLLAEQFGREIGRQLYGRRYTGPPRLQIRRRSHVPPRERPRRVPKSFLDLERDHAAHPGAGKGPRPRRSSE